MQKPGKTTMTASHGEFVGTLVQAYSIQSCFMVWIWLLSTDFILPLRILLLDMVAFYDGKEGAPKFSGPNRGVEDVAVCATGFDSISNLFMFVEDVAKNPESEPSWCLNTFRTWPLKWNNFLECTHRFLWVRGLTMAFRSTKRCRSVCALRNSHYWLTSVNLRQLLDLIPFMVQNLIQKK